jgi:hypothetical protein
MNLNISLLLSPIIPYSTAIKNMVTNMSIIIHIIDFLKCSVPSLPMNTVSRSGFEIAVSFVFSPKEAYTDIFFSSLKYFSFHVLIFY